MKKRLLAVLMSSAMLMSALAGCGGSTAKTNNGGDTADQTTQQDYHIKVILKTLASEYWQYVGNGCKQAGKDLGVTVDVLGASSETAYDEQLSMIETTLSANDCDAMVVAPLQAETVATQIANTDLPIVAIDTAIDSDKVLSFVGFNNEELAAMGGKAAVEAAKDKGWDKITAIGIMGVQGDSTSEARIAGFKQGIAEAGGEYLSAETQYADSVADKAVTCMEAIIQAHPEGVSIIVANNDDMAAGAARAAAAFPAYKNTIFVGVGGNLAGIDAILAGQETMTVAVDGYDVGYLGVQAAVDALNGKKLDEFIATDATVVTADNAAERRAEVEKRLGSDRISVFQRNKNAENRLFKGGGGFLRPKISPHSKKTRGKTTKWHLLSQPLSRSPCLSRCSRGGKHAMTTCPPRKATSSQAADCPASLSPVL